MMATKRENIDDPNSCWNKARDDEQVFILLGRDEQMAGTIRDWADRRIAAGVDTDSSPKILSARRLADDLDRAKVVAPACEPGCMEVASL
jgi:hypothetical protein